MNIGFIDVDGHNGFPNLALMKIARYHSDRGDMVSHYTPFEYYDIVYMSKVFSFTPDYGQVITNAGRIEKGGTGYNIHKELPPEIDSLQPYYDLYPTWDKKTALGFLTRGCPNKCGWCIVPKKEGAVRPYMDIDEICIEGRSKAVLMDNNILASPYGIEQIEKIVSRQYRVDFNQGLDARLVTPEIARLLSKVRWIKHVRFGCDTPKQVEECRRAIEAMQSNGYKGEFLLYCIIKEFDESYARIKAWHGNKKVVVQSQPYIPIGARAYTPPQWQKDIARWTNKKEIWQTTDFENFEPRKGFKCKEYFN